MQKEALMVCAGAQVRIIKQRPNDLKSRVPVARPLLPAAAEHATQTEESLRGNCRRGTIDRLAIVERIGRRLSPVAEGVEPGSTRVPVRNPVRCGRAIDIKV